VAEVAFNEVGKVYEGGVQAVNDLSLEVGDGEFLVLVGPSGCGKTTALRMVAGLEEITEGTVTIGDRVVNDLDPKQRDVAMVFQNYALYPHLSVYENIAFGLRLRREPKNVVEERVAWAAKLLDLTPYLQRRPKELSGGQRQRVAMGRAIVRQPQAFLMDEPLSNLDAKLRVQMRAEVSRLQHELGTTTIYVTHDQIEAMTMGDRVAVMYQGSLQQVAPPQELYKDPVNLFVASFIGSPPMNLIDGRLIERDGGLTAILGEQELAVPDSLVNARPRLRSYAGQNVAVGIRPESLEDAAVQPDAPTGRRLRGRVALMEALGAEMLAHVDFLAKPVVREEVLEGAVEGEQALAESLERSAAELRMTLVGRFDANSQAKPDQEIELVVNTAKLHFFDLDTGLAIDGTAA
jgi:multiple sugar transport system ATP-binding protein